MRGRVPIRPTDIVSTINKKEHKISDHIDHLVGSLKGYNLIVASTDVHEFGKEIVKSVLLQADANVYDLGSSVTVQEIVDTVKETESSVVLISTFNGIALSYAKELITAMKENDLSDVKLIMGGLLNENKDGSDLPIDVADDLKELGISCDNKAENLVKNIKALTA